MSTHTSALGPFVLAALACDRVTLEPGPHPGGLQGLVGLRLQVELPPAGTAKLGGVFVARLWGGGPGLRACEITVAFAPPEELGKARMLERHVIDFEEHPFVALEIDLRDVVLTGPGTHTFMIFADKRLLTISPLLVSPNGMAFRQAPLIPGD